MLSKIAIMRMCRNVWQGGLAGNLYGLFPAIANLARLSRLTLMNSYRCSEMVNASKWGESEDDHAHLQRPNTQLLRDGHCLAVGAGSACSAGGANRPGALMRYILILWASPLLIFWGWFGLSFYDVNFGYVMLTRQVHDLVFELYGEMLGIDPHIIPAMVAKACVFDTLILLAIFAFRRRRQIAARLKARRSRYVAGVSSPSA